MGSRLVTRAAGVGAILSVMAVLGGPLGCAPPKPATPYPKEPAPEGEPAADDSDRAGSRLVDLGEVAFGWFPFGVVLERDLTAANPALAWVDDDGALWLLEVGSLQASEPSAEVLRRARKVEGIDLRGRSLRALERDAGEGALRLLLRDDAGDVWVEVDREGRATTLVTAPAGIADARMLAGGRDLVWSAGPAGQAPARLLTRSRATGEPRILATLADGSHFLARPLAADADARVLWAAIRDRDGGAGIVQVTRGPKATSDADEVTYVPTSATKAVARGRRADDATGTSTPPRDVTLAQDTVDGALVFATWDGVKSTLWTWAPGRKRLTEVLSRPGRILQLRVTGGGGVVAVIEGEREHVRTRIDLTRRRVIEAASLTASLTLLGSIGEDSLWSYSGPDAPLTIVRTHWAEPTVVGDTLEAAATNTPLLLADEPTRLAKARCAVRWVEGGDADGSRRGSWQVSPRDGTPSNFAATRVDPPRAVLPWSVDLAVACAMGTTVTIVTDEAAPLHETDAAGAFVTWRVESAAAQSLRFPLALRRARESVDVLPPDVDALAEFLASSFEAQSSSVPTMP